MSQEPTVLAVLPERPILEFERKTTRQGSLPLVSVFFDVLGMKEPLPKIRRNHIVSGKTRIVESRPIGVDRHAAWVQHNHRLRYCVRNLPKLAFILTQFLLSLLEVFNVSAYPVPHGDLPGFVAEWFKVNEKPTKDPIMAAHARFDVTWFSRAQQLPPFFHE